MASNQGLAPGLKSLRAVRGKTPTFACSNCKCNRYTTCGCMKKARREKAA